MNIFHKLLIPQCPNLCHSFPKNRYSASASGKVTYTAVVLLLCGVPILPSTSAQHVWFVKTVEIFFLLILSF